MKDLCARLPYGVKISINNNSPTILNQIFYSYGLVGKDNELYSLEYFVIKPYLFPLSSITEEQIKELSKLGVSYDEYALHDDIRGLGIMVEDAYIFFEYCYKHHIDFLGLIKMGLAIDATNLNIY